ncbi:hypothetical protein FQB35_05520 [Crassaminicella thermophila]|uniref:Uncharacterized protein n=1 Tax=Crassaminicella thermophila TaxID=2599308 RepID=A0A5C0SG03_CRATE|nr:hypothetical protein [Crassaminicella thermophila]QEK11869.1 hypothetical protein FQB35_05520 [Crassaminicella thermophila]
MFNFIFKVLLFAITIAFLGAWGIIKQQRKTQELLNKLYKNAESKVIKELKNKEELSIKQIEDIIEGTKASLFWSKNKVKITDSRLVSKELMRKMVEKGLVKEEIRKNRKYYILK